MPLSITQARRLRDIPDSALALIEAGHIGLDAVLDSLDLDAPASDERAEWDRVNVGDWFE